LLAILDVLNPYPESRIKFYKLLLISSISLGSPSNLSNNFSISSFVNPLSVDDDSVLAAPVAPPVTITGSYETKGGRALPP
jgi:hypothetical protein